MKRFGSIAVVGALIGALTAGVIATPAQAVGSFSGIVTDAQGEPMVGAAVSAMTSGTSFFGDGPNTTTGADGAFALEIPARPDTRLAATAPGFTPAFLGGDDFNTATVFPVGNDETYADLEIALEPASSTISGTITGPDGSPVPGASIRVDSSDLLLFQPDQAQRRTVVSDDSGSYTVTGLAASEYSVLVDPPPGIPLLTTPHSFTQSGEFSSPKVTTEADTVFTADIQMVAPGSISGTITDPDGLPVANAFVTASGYVEPVGTQTGPDGTYVIDGLYPGRPNVFASPSDGRPLLFTTIGDLGLDTPMVRGNQTVSNVDLQLLPGVRLTTQVFGGPSFGASTIVCQDPGVPIVDETIGPGPVATCSDGRTSSSTGFGLVPVGLFNVAALLWSGPTPGVSNSLSIDARFGQSYLCTVDLLDNESFSCNRNAATAVSAGTAHSCALLHTREVSCWGSGTFGQLGTGNTDSLSSPSLPINFPGGAAATEISAGSGHSCALLNTGEVSCWGTGAGGQLGTGNSADSSAPTSPIALPGGATATAISVGGVHSCALLSTGEVSCWGRGEFGQLGTGDFADALSPSSPIALPGGATAIAISAGSIHTCALLFTGAVSCWGAGFDGQLGTGIPADASAPSPPVELPGGATATAISAGTNHSCALLNSGQVSCWGDGFSGQLGTGETTSSNTPSGPLVLPDGATAIAISIGGSVSCVLLSTGQVSCWGFGLAGGIGSGGTANVLSPSPPIALPGDAIATAISVGGSHACALLNTGKTVCWGEGQSGQLGTGSPLGSLVPVLAGVPLAAIVPTSAVAAAAEFTITFDQPVEGFDASGITISGTAGATAASVTGGPTVYTASVTAPNDGTVIASVGADVATSLLGSPNMAAPASASVTVDVTGPVATLDLAAGQSATTDMTPIAFAVTFDEPVTGFDAADITVAGTAGATAGVVSGSGSEYTITVDTVPGSGTVTVTVAGGAVVDAAGNASTTTVVADTVAFTATPGKFVSSVPPARVVDTRAVGETVDDLFEKGGRLTAGSTLPVDIAGRAGVPDDAKAVVVNVTSVKGSGLGFLTVHPCLDTTPGASSLNFDGANTPNEIIAGLSADGQLCVFTSTDTDLLVDVVGFVGTDSAYQPLAPARILETRLGQETVDGMSAGEGAVKDGDTIELEVRGRAGVTEDANAVVLNITSVKSVAEGFVTVYPCLAEVPGASSLNYTAGANRANEIIAELSADGTVCLFVSDESDLLVDVVGQLSADSGYNPVAPARLVDTRSNGETVDEQQQATGRLDAAGQIPVDVAERAGVPADASAVVANVTAVRPGGNGFITTFDCGAVPNASSLNYVQSTVANELIVELNDDGDFCVFAAEDTDVLVDVVGWL